ncbi:MAG: hypothetical protein NTX24_01025 [Candidatus Pacearchaeota archaeon]|nr:hypothetical protein [Candidatus Pacearchaeota archaeon]
MNQEEAFFNLMEKLRDLNYCFISGTAVSVYSDGKREAKDLDIVLDSKDIDTFAERMGCTPNKRITSKGNFLTEDYVFETDFSGLSIEAISTEKGKQTTKMQKTFEHKVKKKYLGEEIYVTPIEELVSQKAFTHRDKDLADLELLKNIPLNQNLLLEFVKEWGNSEEIINLLKQIGFKIK